MPLSVISQTLQNKYTAIININKQSIYNCITASHGDTVLTISVSVNLLASPIINLLTLIVMAQLRIKISNLTTMNLKVPTICELYQTRYLISNHTAAGWCCVNTCYL